MLFGILKVDILELLNASGPMTCSFSLSETLSRKAQAKNARSPISLKAEGASKVRTPVRAKA